MPSVRISNIRTAVIVAVFLFAFAMGAVMVLPLGSERSSAEVRIRDISFSAEIVRTGAERSLGLGERTELGAQSGMLFVFDAPGRYGIWMKRMRFPIDIFWIRDGRIVDIEERAPVPPLDADDATLPVYIPEAAADHVFETNAGVAAAYGFAIGDEVRIFADR